jgi:hypothetical protein
MSPYLLEFKDYGKIFSISQQNEKKWKKKKKGEHGVHEKEGAPDPLKWINKEFQKFSQALKIESRI